MYIRRRLRSKLIVIALIVLGFVYWRGVKALAVQKNLECKYHLVYAVCKQKGQATTLPSIWEVLKAGSKF